jgi:hypothetical protein
MQIILILGTEDGGVHLGGSMPEKLISVPEAELSGNLNL